MIDLFTKIIAFVASVYIGAMVIKAGWIAFVIYFIFVLFLVYKIKD